MHKIPQLIANSIYNTIAESFFNTKKKKKVLFWNTTAVENWNNESLNVQIISATIN